MEIYTGDVIEESLTNSEVLQSCEILSTRVSLVTEAHRTPWLTQWTVRTISVSGAKANALATDLSRSLDRNHPGSWYVDFKSESHHYVVYPDKVFLIDRAKPEQYRQATEYGISIGIPAHQVDFEPHMKKAI